MNVKNLSSHRAKDERCYKMGENMCVGGWRLLAEPKIQGLKMSREN